MALSLEAVLLGSRKRFHCGFSSKNVKHWCCVFGTLWSFLNTTTGNPFSDSAWKVAFDSNLLIGNSFYKLVLFNSSELRLLLNARINFRNFLGETPLHTRSLFLSFSKALQIGGISGRRLLYRVVSYKYLGLYSSRHLFSCL